MRGLEREASVKEYVRMKCAYEKSYTRHQRAGAITSQMRPRPTTVHAELPRQERMYAISLLASDGHPLRALCDRVTVVSEVNRRMSPHYDWCYCSPVRLAYCQLIVSHCKDLFKVYQAQPTFPSSMISYIDLSMRQCIGLVGVELCRYAQQACLYRPI